MANSDENEQERAEPSIGPAAQAGSTSESATGGTRRNTIELFLISFLILFFELTCIRWFGSVVIFLTFFTNIVLMACFLGVAVGCLATARPVRFVQGFIPGTLVAVVLAYAIVWGYFYFDSKIMVDVGGQRSPQEIYFGADSRIDDPSRFVIPIELIAGVFFTLVTLIFVGLGQEMGRRFNAIRDPLTAYTADILGSLTGIAAFAAGSFWNVPSRFWFAISLGLGLCFVPRRRLLHLTAVIAVYLIVATRIDTPKTAPGQTAINTWSPYNLVSYKVDRRWIDVNNLAHQGMHPIDESGPAYLLPHLLNRDADRPPFRDVLIIGAGSGNDVAAALEQGATHIDAVEIDPVIQQIGRRDHPDHPYADARVTVHLDDGRGFLRKTNRRYDLIIYALVDSLALHSGYSSLRLESFLFTEEAFREARSKLKPGGVFALYNFYRQGWVVGRLDRLGTSVFGEPPLVVSMPYQPVITAENNQRGFITFLLLGEPGNPSVRAIRSRFDQSGSFWLNTRPAENLDINGFGPSPPARGTISADKAISGSGPGTYERIALARVEAPADEILPTDDWPFLYLRQPSIPALNLRGMALVAILSIVIFFVVAPPRRFRPNGQMFFLGAGFMLLETKGVVHMALLFSATWLVNSIVFFAILTMILLANLYVLKVRPGRLWPYYLLLIAALLVNSVIPMATFLSLPGVMKIVASCAVVFLPVFFAGVIFATSFRASRQPDVDFGSNVGGIILGGLSEYLSLLLGFNHLLWVAIAYYVLSAWLGRGRTSRI